MGLQALRAQLRGPAFGVESLGQADGGQGTPLACAAWGSPGPSPSLVKLRGCVPCVVFKRYYFSSRAPLSN